MRLDPSRLASAIQRPGTDTREWVTRARIVELGYDKDHGVFADVQCLPGGEKETCLIGSDYAGDGFGKYMPPTVGDIVLVAIPQGDPGEGPVIFARLWHAGDKPAPEMAKNDDPTSNEPTANPTFRLQDGTVARTIGRNSSTVKVELSGTSALEIVATEGSRVAVSADTTVDITGTAKVQTNSDALIVLEAPAVRIGASALRGIARIQDLTIAGTGAQGMLAALATAAAASATAWTFVGGAVPGAAATAGPAAAGWTTLADTLTAAAAQWGQISTASAKGFSE